MPSKKGTGKKKGEKNGGIPDEDLRLRISRVKRLSRKKSLLKRIGKTGATYLTCVLEHIVTEVLEGAAKKMKKDKVKTIQPKHIALAISDDDRLKVFFSECDFGAFVAKPLLCMKRSKAMIDRIKSKNKLTKLKREADYCGIKMIGDHIPRCEDYIQALKDHQEDPTAKEFTVPSTDRTPKEGKGNRKGKRKGKNGKGR